MATPAAAASAPEAVGVRDLFAAHLMAALLVMPKQAGVLRLDKESMARQAFELADAMMKIRDA
jgi:hypothetical protein